MSRTFTVQPEAQAEIGEIYDHLEEVKDGLGGRFVDALEACFRYIKQFPFGHQLRRKHYRHTMVSGFDYRVVYMVDDQGIFVYQVRHTSRKLIRPFGP